MQYLVKLRWDELCSAEQMDISSASLELMSEVASDPCEESEMKSETITLVAEVRAVIAISLFYDWLINQLIQNFVSRCLKRKIWRCGRSCFSH